MTDKPARTSRRRFLIQGGLAVGAAATLGASRLLAQEPAGKPATAPAAASQPQEIPVQPLEDLMREHGLLRRIMLVQDEATRRLEGGQEVSMETVAAAGDIVRRFIQDYHEKLEEDYLFPIFRKAGKDADLVKVLLAQHQAGRQVMDTIIKTVQAKSLTPYQKARLAESLRAFSRMYRPHAAREDTVLFPDFHWLVTPRQYAEMGDTFEGIEKQKFGDQGFEKIVAQVADLEKALGIGDLAKFTPTTT